MKKSFTIALAVGAIGLFTAPASLTAQGMGYGHSAIRLGNPHDNGLHRGWRHRGCHWVAVSRHHHRTMIKVCGR